jgi:hypothetical protein
MGDGWPLLIIVKANCRENVRYLTRRGTPGAPKVFCDDLLALERVRHFGITLYKCGHSMLTPLIPKLC